MESLIAFAITFIVTVYSYKVLLDSIKTRDEWQIVYVGVVVAIISGCSILLLIRVIKFFKADDEELLD